MKDSTGTVTQITIQGNSYSLDFCKQFSEVFLSKAENLKVYYILDCLDFRH
jgi:hypothetical protein